MTYDLAGNLINDGTLTYSYDAWDRQVGVATAASTPVPVATYEFDGLNRRVQETVYNAGGDGQRRNRLLLRRGRADPGAREVPTGKPPR